MNGMQTRTKKRDVNVGNAAVRWRLTWRWIMDAATNCTGPSSPSSYNLQSRSIPFSPDCFFSSLRFPPRLNKSRQQCLMTVAIAFFLWRHRWKWYGRFECKFTAGRKVFISSARIDGIERNGIQELPFLLSV